MAEVILREESLYIDAYYLVSRLKGMEKHCRIAEEKWCKDDDESVKKSWAQARFGIERVRGLIAELCEKPEWEPEQ